MNILPVSLLVVGEEMRGPRGLGIDDINEWWTIHAESATRIP